jgi:cell division protein FtsW (lipid II flippase)
MTKAFSIAAPVLFTLAILLTVFALGSSVFAAVSFNSQQIEGASRWMAFGLFFEMLVRQIGWAGLLFACAAIIHRLDRRSGVAE